MTEDEAKAEGYAAGFGGKPSYLAPHGLYNRIWLSAWIDGRVDARKAHVAPASRPAAGTRSS